MENEIIDIYEKYANLFRIRVTPDIKQVRQLPYLEAKKHPVTVRTGKDLCVSLTGEEKYPVVKPEPITIKNIIKKIICARLEATPRLKLNPIKTQLIDTTSTLKEYGNKAVVVYSGCDFRILNIGQEYFLCLDHKIRVRNFLKVADILALLPGYDFTTSKGFYKTSEGWQPGRVDKIDGEEITLLTRDGSVTLPQDNFLPDIPAAKIAMILSRKGGNANFNQELKSMALLTVNKAPLQRFQTIQDIAQSLSQTVFPIKIGKYELYLDPNPVRLMSPVFDVRDDLSEPYSTFDHEDETKKSQATLDGLIAFGSFDKPKKDLNAVILCTNGTKDAVNSLLDRISNGHMKYVGIEKTFGEKLNIMEWLLTQDVNEYLDKCKEFIQGPGFLKADIFLVYMPEDIGKASYDSPYYKVKKLLLKNGIPSQMVDAETLADPTFKELNLALNIFAKTGNAPWVLDDEMQGADLFVGLSYSAIKRFGRIERMIACVNVFDKFGRWRFYQGNIEAFPYEERHKHYKEIIRSSIQKYQSENHEEEIRNIHIHYTQRMKWKDREAISEEVTKILPECKTVFVYIDIHLPIRLFDKASLDGSMERGSYVLISKNQFWLSTTGHNVYGQKGLGTPRILAVTVYPAPKTDIGLKAIAQHILSLTKLNWASTRSFCHEPITTKYAGDISYLMNIFMKDPNFSISERIRNKAWFL